jgi:hypothetical protein
LEAQRVGVTSPALDDRWHPGQDAAGVSEGTTG